MKFRMTVWTLTLATALLAGPAMAQLAADAGAGLCGANKESQVLVSLADLGMGPGEHALAFRVLYDGQELFTEDYRVRVDAAGAVLPVWLGGVAEQGLRNREGELLAVTVEAVRGGEAVASWSLDSFLRQGAGLEASGAAEALILERNVEEPQVGGSKPVLDEVVSLNQSSSVICPNAFPYCDNQYDACEWQCYMDGSCYQRCLDEFDECVYGINYTYTQTTETNRRYAGRACAYYPWYKYLNPKYWDYWNVVYQVREYDRTYCPRTGHTFDTLIRQYTTSDDCYRESPFGCGGNAFYLGGYCRE